MKKINNSQHSLGISENKQLVPWWSKMCYRVKRFITLPMTLMEIMTINSKEQLFHSPQYKEELKWKADHFSDFITGELADFFFMNPPRYPNDKHLNAVGDIAGIQNLSKQVHEFIQKFHGISRMSPEEMVLFYDFGHSMKIKDEFIYQLIGSERREKLLQALEMRAVKRNLRKPRPIIPHFTTHGNTLGILVLDGSSSMSEQNAQHISKGYAVSLAIRDVLSRFKASRNRDSFSFAIVNYDHRSIVKMKPTPVKDVDNHIDYSPMDGLGGDTYIFKGLEDAEIIAKDYLSHEEGQSRNVVIVVMAAGVDMKKTETIIVANRLKKMKDVFVSGCYFENHGADQGEMEECADHIRNLCSTPDSFKTVNDTYTLKIFFESIMELGVSRFK